MATTKVYCDILDIFGIDWSGIQPHQIDCIIQTVNALELLGGEDELFGFVGTAYLNDVIAGFFMIQFPTEILSYSIDKTANRETTKPAERVFFTLLPKYGKILIQNRRFEILPISMEAVYRRIYVALSEVMRHCKVGAIVSLIPTTSIVGRNELLEYYRESRRVKRIKVENPNPKRIPEGLEYYNPLRDRNAIIRDSRSHDYPKLKSVDIKAKETEDLRNTHLGKDLIYSVTDSDPFIMEFEDSQQKSRVVRRTATRTPLEFYIDVDTDQLNQQTIMQVIDVLAKEVALDINLGGNEINIQSTSDFQLSFLDETEGENREGEDE